MIMLYCTLIINKRRTFEQVPDKIQREVREKLESLGYDIYGDSLTKEG